ncbi:hypothetical protein RFI_03174 [Reticulomyxa filosa]|uniref:Uncharacterized protein n=1 Tax=Reticulomyxa filosa TaxID=46433 RepID=X6P6X3_RETFI|nr:hypothetical protein RFI_03174 [Reticulomyxa filosa]|eukprot:ETO33926.1 hypothetical protein RFI_03174 [Reticulomyxa filosa]
MRSSPIEILSPSDLIGRNKTDISELKTNENDGNEEYKGKRYATVGIGLNNGAQLDQVNDTDNDHDQDHNQDQDDDEEDSPNEARHACSSSSDDSDDNIIFRNKMQTRKHSKTRPKMKHKQPKKPKTTTAINDNNLHQPSLTATRLPFQLFHLGAFEKKKVKPKKQE